MMSTSELSLSKHSVLGLRGSTLQRNYLSLQFMLASVSLLKAFHLSSTFNVTLPSYKIYLTNSLLDPLSFK